MKSLYECLLGFKDFRRKQGVRTPVTAFLEMIILAEMSGNNSIRSISRFIKRNEAFYVDRYNLEHGVPSYGTLRDFLKGVEGDELSLVLKDWCLQFIEQGDWVAVDGKAINSTVTNKHGSGQNYLSMVSLFCSRQGIVIGSEPLENKKENEIMTAKELISKYELSGVTFTMDALHCQKKLRKPSWSQEMIMSFK